MTKIPKLQLGKDVVEPLYGHGEMLLDDEPDLSGIASFEKFI